MAKQYPDGRRGLGQWDENPDRKQQREEEKEDQHHHKGKEEEVPRDKYKTVYWIIFLVGGGKSIY